MARIWGYFKTSYSLLFFLVLVLAVVPLLIKSPYVISILTLAILYAIFAASWDLVAGYTGQLVLGQALFIGVGGYSIGLYAQTVGIPAALIIGVLLSSLFALLIGLPCIKLSGPFLSLTSLVMPLILERLAFTFRNFTGGEYGLTIVSPFSRMELYYAALILMFIAVFALISIARSRLGKIFLAIRENELGVAAAGNNVANYKLLSFLISAVFTGLAGSFLAIYLRHIGPGSFAMATSLNVVIMGIIGGMGTIIGPVVGAFGLTILGEFLRDFGKLDELIYAVILILAVLLFPKGFAGLNKTIPFLKLLERRFGFGSRNEGRIVK